MQCIQCSKEFQAIRVDAKFCSPYCRVKFNRLNDTDNLSVSNDTDNDTDKISVPIPEPKQILAPELSKLTAEELYTQIDSFQGGNEWADSVFYKELTTKRLKTLSIKQLRDQGFYVPSWKLNGCKCPF